MVVAETMEQANAAAALIEVTYQRDARSLLRLTRERLPCSIPDTGYDADAPRTLAAADVQVKEIYTTTSNTNNPIGLFAQSRGEGDALTVHDTTQYPHAVRMRWRPRSASMQPACACWCRSSAVLAQDCACGCT
jgi:CO/xanthine dehydrogenase Mo-binding subunit